MSLEIIPASAFAECHYPLSLEALDICSNGRYKNKKGEEIEIREKIIKSIQETESFDPTIQFYYKKNEPKQGKIYVIAEKSVDCAIRLRYKYPNHRIALLNFANPYQPGGGFLGGAIAQEECICRATALYPSICRRNEFFDYNINVSDSYGSDYLIFSPNVPIFKNDSYEPLECPLEVSMITSAAVIAFRIKSTSLLKKDLDMINTTMHQRIKKIIELAIYKKVQVLILGAFGCGAFGNDPDEVAKSFKYWLIEKKMLEFFDEVVFPIPGSRTNNLGVFSKVLNK